MNGKEFSDRRGILYIESTRGGNRPMARNCPNCSAEMRIEEVYGVKLDVCPECAGIWLDSGELRTLLAQDPLVLSKLEDLVELEDLTQIKIEQQPGGPSLRHCPECDMLLQEYNY